MVYDLLWNDGNGESEVFIASRCSPQVNILDISHQILGFRYGDGTVDDDIGGCGISGWGADISGIFNQIATHIQSCVVRFVFMRAIVHYDSSISNFTDTILGDKGIIYKIDGVSTLNSIAYALCQSDQFVRKRSSPWNSVLGDIDQVTIFH